MPIAFDPPTHAPHGTLPTRGPRTVDDDPASLDIFTQLLLAAANVQDAAAPPEPSARAAKDDSANASDASVLCLPLPAPLLAGMVPAADTVKIVASEKVADVRGAPAATNARTLVDALRAARTGAAAPTTGAPAAVAATTTGAATPSTAPASPGDTAQPSPRPSALPALATATADPAEPQATPAPMPARPAAPAVSNAANALAALITPIAIVTEKPTAATKAVEPAATPPMVAPALTPAAPQVPVETISAPAFTPGWQDETVSKLAQVILTRNERAELKLNPAELGPVNVRVELRADQVSVQIVAASPETRSALEQSLPQLRDLLATQGITLGQASVHDGTAQRDPRAEGWTTPRPSSAESAATPVGPTETLHAVVRRADRLLDIYA